MFPSLYQSTEVAPIAAPGQFVLLQEPTVYSLFQVSFLEPLVPSQNLIVDLTNGTALAAGAVGTKFSLSALSMADGELGHFRAHVLDDVQVTIWQGQQLGRFTTRTNQTFLSPYSRFRDADDSLTEMFVWQTNYPWAQATNPQTVAVNKARVKLQGFRYVLSGSKGTEQEQGGGILSPITQWLTLRDAVNSGQKFIVVPISGWQR